MDKADAATHEAVHACVASLLERRVEWVRVAPRPVPGRTDLVERGGCMLDRNRQLNRADLAVFLSAGMYEGNGIAFDDGAGDHGLWPPLWPILPGEGDRNQVEKIVRGLGLTEAQYADTIAQTRELLDEPALQRWIANVSRVLERDGHLTGDQVEALRPTEPPSPTRTVVPEQETTCST